MIDFFKEYGWGAVLAYLILERMFPIVSVMLKQAIPAQIKLRFLQEQQKRDTQKEALEISEELEARRIDLREREVLAMENISKHMVLTNAKLDQIDNRMDMSERTMNQVGISLATSNQTLAILLELSRSTRRKNSRRRRTDGGTTQPMKRIEK